MTKLHLALGLTATGLIVWACSTGESGGLAPVSGTGGTGVDLGGPSGTGGANGPLPEGSSTLPITGPDGEPLGRRPPICDTASPPNCTCTTFASLGAAASKAYGNATNGVPDSTDAFQAWLTTKSNLQSIMFYPAKPAVLTKEWLDQWDVILLQDMRGWTFAAEEVAAFQTWVQEGGGVIALSGYYSDNALEIDPTNQLLAFSNIGLLPTEVPGLDCGTATAESSAVCPNTSTQGKCYCWGNSLPLVDWNTGHAIARDVRSVGSFRGRAVNPGDGETVVSFKGTPVGATKTMGTGKIFIFGDEWVTYSSQWLNGGQVTSDPYNPCWDTTAGASCLAGHVFQVMQFWYNSILYVAPPTPQCVFKIDEPVIVVPIT